MLIGGIIPEADIPGLKKAGIAEIFLPGTSTQDIVEFVRASACRTRRRKCDRDATSRPQRRQRAETDPESHRSARSMAANSRTIHSSPDSRRTRAAWSICLTEIKNEEADPPGRRRESHRGAAKKGRLTARERIAKLIDPETRILRAGPLRRVRNVRGVGRRARGRRGHRARPRVRAGW